MEVINLQKFNEETMTTVEQVVSFGDIYNVSTPQGNAILISEQEFRNMLATLEIDANEYLKEKLLEGLRTPIEDFVSGDELEW